ncbi:hypothetical protein [Tateyamaria pelophila]|uniref:hypothetical protein n=1 Tax=Tateyamaria pelophila TaxID=328415 RepID=UPI001CBC2380|nr:hypothetical protein [Tateyamaria pelophila]
MTSNNKILTVSYGTFSCTLEGFDDNFGTMKAIAEYFRDLASDDRYFGAEPPQPDVEMLARIAEREISRRVDARKHDGRYVLSAEQAQVSAAASPTGLDAQAHPSETAEHTSPGAQDITETVADHPHQQNAMQQNVTECSEEDGASANFGRSNVDSAQEAFETEAAASDAESVANPADIDASSAQDAEQFFAQPDPETDLKAAEVIAEAEPVDRKEAPAPDSIAAKLQRIRAVVTKSRDDIPEEVFEDEYAEDLAPSAPADTPILDQVVAGTDTDAVADPAESSVIVQAALAVETLQEAENAAIEEDENESESDDVTALLARFDTEENSLAAANTEQTDESSIDAEVEDDVLLLDTLASYTGENANSKEDDEDDANLFDDGLATEIDHVESIQTRVEDTTDSPEVKAARARIIKVKRSEIDAAIASGALEEVDDASENDTSSFDAQNEEQLSASADPDIRVSQEETVDANHDAANDTDDTTTQPTVEDDDVSRLMAEVDTQMDEPESTNRRSAFAHLKAAVMAKKADLGIGKEDEGKDGAYRSDLASVVKPRRPEGRGVANTSESKRPAPLKLVAEQRVDIDKEPTGPVRPRRVAAREDVPNTAAETSFQDYANEMGAHDLPELLEAAASYLSFVEGRDQFSRPQLMTKVRQIEKGDFNREDGLRSFGQLLRAGKIEKIKGGRFAVTGDIGYRPDHRAAG